MAAPAHSPVWTQAACILDLVFLVGWLTSHRLPLCFSLAPALLREGDEATAAMLLTAWPQVSCGFFGSCSEQFQTEKLRREAGELVMRAGEGLHAYTCQTGLVGRVTM